MRIIIFLLLISFIIKPACAQWTGSVSLFEKFTGEGTFAGSVIETHVDVSFSGAIPTLGRNVVSNDYNFTDDKGTGSITISGQLSTPDKGYLTGKCNGTGQAQLFEVGFHPDGTYRISAIGPSCKTGTGLNLLNGEVTICCDPEDTAKGTDITIPDQPLGSNPNVLSGTYTEIVNGGLGPVTHTYTWQLVRSFDAVLIVTPQNYDKWLPEPSRDETTHGTVMNISLKVQKRNGQPSTIKAKEFELRLSKTSNEPGITLNFPLSPTDPALPDLRFLEHPNAESFEEDQFIKINSYDGSTGKAWIGSYDGGGWTTLSVEATLEGDIRIKGKLLIPTGEEDILIPKRKDASSKIATAWLNAHGNPGEMDDKETSTENFYKGDGLTAYEEYRGVISQGKFKRLDPQKKEVGIDVIKDELSFFSEGIKWFEKATGLTAVIFHEDLDEVGLDRRLNKNAQTNHDYNQYVLRLSKSIIPGDNTLGKAYGGPGIPEKIRIIVIDYPVVQRQVPYWQNYARELKMTLSFTVKDLLAKTIAHELGHGVNCWHHGNGSLDGDELQHELDSLGLDYRLFSDKGTEITLRPYPLDGPAGPKGSQESGDLSCVMAYQPHNKWSMNLKNGMRSFFMVPRILPLGKSMCRSGEGTDFNKKDASGNNDYFGNAHWGNCRAQIKLRD